MFNNITVKAGKNAYTLIKDGGFDPSLIRTIPAASGGPKFLVLTGMDRVICSEWFSRFSKPVNWIASSIGSWRGSAVTQSDPLKALDILEEAYIHQQYSADPNAAEVTQVAWDLLNTYVPDDEIPAILSNGTLNFHIISARSRGLGKSSFIPFLGLHLAGAMTANMINRKLSTLFFSRSVYSADTGLPPSLGGLKDFATSFHKLDKTNLKKIVMASGAIPIAMESIQLEDGTVMRDGGVVDYHFDIPFSDDGGITFYPHYTDRIIPGWFDKNLPWRHGGEENHANTVLISPSPSFLDSLPNGKIPDRGDFTRYNGRDRDRFTDWGRIVKSSRVLGDEMLEAFESGRVKEILKPL